jgi:anti-sigma-K factor RskA
MSTDAINKRMDEGAKRQQQAADKAATVAEHQRLLSDFNAADKEAIKKMSDDALSAWQAQYPKESPQAIFADQLWKYRLAKRSALFAACVAAPASLLGSILGRFIS